MKNIRRLRKSFLFIIIILPIIFSSITNSLASELYDLCFHTEILNLGKILFLRHKNPLLDPVLRTYEINLFDPLTGKLSSLKKHGEMLYIPPVISRDKTTISYHCLIEGNDFLITKNIDIWKSTRLRFDTGGYFVSIGIDYDNDRVASAIKRGKDKQAIYIISNRSSTIKRILTGTNFSEIGFLHNGNIYYVDNADNQRVLGLAYEKTKRSSVIARDVDYVKRAPNGNAIIYSKGKDLYLFRVDGNESIKISQNFDIQRHLPLFSPDGTTFALFEKSQIYIVNVSSGDIFYYLSMDTENTKGLLTNFTFYITKGNKLFHLKHKKPGQSLQELYKEEDDIQILSISPNDRHLVYQMKNEREIIVFDTKENTLFRKEFPFTIQEVMFTVLNDTFYIIGLSEEPQKHTPVRELYLYNFRKESIFPISSLSNTDIKPYLRKE